MLVRDKSQMITVLTPAFRWAQSLNEVFLEVKFATRIDSPACIDLFNKTIVIESNYVKVEAVCRNDKRLLHYVLEVNLHSHVSPVKAVSTDKIA